MSLLRYYDEAVLEYFKTIEIEDGETKRNPQVVLAIPSRQGVKLNVNNDNVPILPLISVSRVGLSPNDKTRMVKGHIHRPTILNMDINNGYYTGTELMSYDFNYQVNIFALMQDMYHNIIEQIIFKMYKQHFVRTHIEINDILITHNAYIYNISYTDSTTYQQISANTSRIFNGTITFTIEANIINGDFKTMTVLNEISNQYNDEELLKVIETSI